MLIISILAVVVDSVGADPEGHLIFGEVGHVTVLLFEDWYIKNVSLLIGLTLENVRVTELLSASQ